MISIYYGMELLATLPRAAKPKLGSLLTLEVEKREAAGKWRVVEIRGNNIYCDIPMCIETVGYRETDGKVY